MEKGGHYFIDTRAKTDSLNDLEEDGSVMVSENRVNPIKGELRESEETLSGEVHLSQNSGYQGRANQRKKAGTYTGCTAGSSGIDRRDGVFIKRKQKKERAGGMTPAFFFLINWNAHPAESKIQTRFGGFRSLHSE